MAAIVAQSFAQSRRAALPAVALGLATTGAGGYLWHRGEPLATWAVAVGFGLFLTVWLGLPVWRRVPGVWFDAQALHSRIPGLHHLPWRDIGRLAAVRAGRRTFLAIERTAVAQTRRPPLLRLLAQRAGAADLALPLDGLAAPPAEVAAAVQAAWRQALLGPG